MNKELNTSPYHSNFDWDIDKTHSAQYCTYILEPIN